MTRPNHGGDVWKYGGRVIDFSSNLNPLGPPKVLEEAIREAVKLHVYTLYPDPSYRSLIKTISAFFNVDESRITVSNGATEAIYTIMSALRPRKVILTPPSFEEYWYSAKLFRAEIVEVPLISDGNEYKLDLEAVVKEFRSNRTLILLCNPNNPTGSSFDPHIIEHLVSAAPNDSYVVVDESFIEFSAKGSVLEKGDLEGTIVVKSLTKIFSVPGLRLGCIAADEKIVRLLDDHMPTWRVNSIADYAFSRLLNATPEVREYLNQAKSIITSERVALSRGLYEMGLKPYASDSNFLLVNLAGKIRSSVLKEELALKHDILIRDASSFPGLNWNFIRVSVRKAEENRVLLRSLSEVLSR